MIQWDLARYQGEAIYPLSLRVLWKPGHPGSTRIWKRKRKAGKGWTPRRGVFMQQGAKNLNLNSCQDAF